MLLSSSLCDVTIQTCDSKYDTWEPINNSPDSENMISEFNNKWEEVYKAKMADIAEAGADGDDDDEEGKSEEGETEH